jgi:hypothetical protein
VLATLFFSTLSSGDGVPGDGVAVVRGRELLAAERSLLVTLGLIVLGFAVGWLLPRRARHALERTSQTSPSRAPVRDI